MCLPVKRRPQPPGWHKLCKLREWNHSRNATWRLSPRSSMADWNVAMANGPRIVDTQRDTRLETHGPSRRFRCQATEVARASCYTRARHPTKASRVTLLAGICGQGGHWSEGSSVTWPTELRMRSWSPVCPVHGRLFSLMQLRQSGHVSAFAQVTTLATNPRQQRDSNCPCWATQSTSV